MAIIWADSFDHYGTSPNGGRDLMLSGAWAEFSYANNPAIVISTDQARTGSNSLKMQYNTLATAGTFARRVLGAAKTIIGTAFGIYFESLPDTNNNHGFEIRNGSNACIVRFTVESDGSIGVRSGTGGATNLGASDPVITASAWQHIEAKVVIDAVVGSIEIRVNTEVVFNMTNLNLGAAGATQIVYGMPDLDTGGSLIYYFDDIIAWDDSGSFNNDFLGQQRVETVFAAADTAQADWVANGAASGYDCIDDVPPDADTTYISAANVNDISEFTLDTLPPETNTIAGVYIPVLAKISAAGTGNIQVSLVSGGVASLGEDQVLTTAYTYWGNKYPVDPDTGVQWTKSGLEAALLRVEKTA